MDTEILLREFKDSPAGKALVAQHETGRQAKRRAAVEAIAKAEREYDAERGALDPRIETAQKTIQEFRKKFEGAREELNRLGSEKRIGYINRDNLVSTQQGLLKESAHPAIQSAIDECWKKLNELKGESGERKNKPNIWGAVTQVFWSNARSVGARKTVIRKVLEKLQGMELKAIEDEPAEVKKLMDSIPRDPLESDYDEVSYEPEARRLTNYPTRSTRV